MKRATTTSPLLTSVTFIIPTTDDGGSTAEILRYFGGPAIGDIRNRLLRLASERTPEARAIKHVLQLRLPGRNTSHCLGAPTSTTRRSQSFHESTFEWKRVLDGTHPLWTRDISDQYRTTVLAFLNYFDEQVQARLKACPELGPFDYRNGSIGNFFFTGARLFFRSLSAAIFWWSRVAQIPECTRVVSATKTQSSHSVTATCITLGADLRISNTSVGEGAPHFFRVIGQSAISHPEQHLWGSEKSSCSAESTSHLYPFLSAVSLPNTTTPKDTDKLTSGIKNFPQGAKISRLFHVEMPSGQCMATSPMAHPRALEALRMADTIVYGIGSLFTSIIASLISGGIGEAIRSNGKASKVLVLNGHNDRETGGFCALDYVHAIASALDGYACQIEEDQAQDSEPEAAKKTTSTNPTAATIARVHEQTQLCRSECLCLRQYVNVIVMLESGNVPWSRAALQANGIKVVLVKNSVNDKATSNEELTPQFNAEDLARILVSIAASNN